MTFFRKLEVSIDTINVVQILRDNFRQLEVFIDTIDVVQSPSPTDNYEQCALTLAQR